MILEDQVVSLKISEEMHILGFPQKSHFYTNTTNGKVKYGDPISSWTSAFTLTPTRGKWVSAYTVTELFEFLQIPNDEYSQFKIIKSPASKNSWEFYYRSSKNRYMLMTNESLVDGMGELLIYLVTNKMISI